jgi:hypothetical protein
LDKLPSRSGRLPELARRLRARGDAINGAVWFAAADGGYPPLPLVGPTAAMTARAACLGAVPPEVAASLFAPIEPSNLMTRLREAWQITTPGEMLECRESAVIIWLERALGGVPHDLEPTLGRLEAALDAAPTAAHPVFAALRALPRPHHPLARLQRAAEMIRERRGDSHRNAWAATGLSPVEICVLTDAWRGLDLGAVTCTAMGWPRAAADEAARSLRERGWLSFDTITDAGRGMRELIESATDTGEGLVLDGLGRHADAVITALDPWARAIVAAGAGTR